jgi:peroxiredoxin
MKHLLQRKALVALVLAASAAIAAGFWLSSGQARAPQLVYTTIDGRLIIPGDLQNRVVVVNFWATDCVPCVKELPRLVKTYEQFRPLGLATIAVAMSYDRPDRVVEFARRNHLPFNVALDVQGDVARGFGDVSVTPMTFVIDKRGRIIQRYRGEIDFASLDRLLEKVLAQPA